MIDDILEKVTKAYENCRFIQAIVLGGSRATQSSTSNSDVDIGIYYDKDEIDYKELNKIAKKLDDRHQENLICAQGGWGKWVNCGGWLLINGINVDLIFRDWKKVKKIVSKTQSGLFSCHYQTGHPHVFTDLMYRGELAACKILYAKKKKFIRKKLQAELYPLALRKALIDFFMFEANFSTALIEKNMAGNDHYYLTGLLFRAVSSLNQVLFALNKQWLLNEKKAVFRIDAFSHSPAMYSKKIIMIFDTFQHSPDFSIAQLRELLNEVTNLIYIENK